MSRISEPRVRLFRAYGGCRVGRVIDEERTVEGRPSATVTIRTAARRWHVQVRAGG